MSDQSESPPTLASRSHVLTDFLGSNVDLAIESPLTQSRESPSLDDSDFYPTSSGEQSTPAGPSRSNSCANPKRKRGRVNPAQLAYLERAYIADRSLDAARRREISQKLGMEERQTQIWFQNRRAKTKLLAQRAAEAGLTTPTETLMAPLSNLPEDIYTTLQEDTPIHMIPCSDVIVGKWRRMNSGNNDLLVYISEPKRTITYYIRSSGMGFKMRVSFDSIVATEYANDVVPGSDRMSLLLNKPPTFLREVASSVNASMKSWQSASDWTEGAQASMYTRHEIIGPAGFLGSSFAPLLNSGTCLSSITRSSSPNGPSAPSYFQPSPSLTYSPSSAGGTASNSSSASPPPLPYVSNLTAMQGSEGPGSSSSSLPDSVDFSMSCDQQIIRNENSRSRPPTPIQFPPDHFTPSNPSYPFGQNSQYSHPSTGSTSSTSSVFDAEFDSPFPGGASSMSSALSAGVSTPLSFEGAVVIPKYGGGYMDHQPQHGAPLYAGSLPSDASPLDYEFGYPISDVDLLPENFPANVSRPSSSAGSFVTNASVPVGKTDSPLAKSWTAGTVAMNIPQRRSSSSDVMYARSAGAASALSAASFGSFGTRFMDLYSSKSLNLASYILGQGETPNGVANPLHTLTPGTPSHSDLESQPFPPPQQDFISSVWSP